MINKKAVSGLAWFWIVIALLIVAGIVLYFVLSGDGGSIASTGGAGSNSASNIPQPPALPSG